MNKSTHFTGQPLFSQLIKLLPKQLVTMAAVENNADAYYKKFDTWHHLVTMLFSCYGHCNSLREISSGMRAMEGKLLSAGITHFPARSTISDANSKRTDKVFESVYYALKDHWERILPDSRKKNSIKIFDSTSISLFQEIFKGSGMCKANGKKKGGLKVHVSMNDGASSPDLVFFTDGARNDVVLLPHLDTTNTDTLIFDRGYKSYSYYEKWTNEGKTYVTRLIDTTYILEKDEKTVSQEQKDLGIEKDLWVRIGHPNKQNNKIQARIVHFTDQETGRFFKILTNNYVKDPYEIAALYKKRWQIELLFKRLKQNMPLQYFLGDNQNAIKIQIWCALIADLLLQVVKRMVKRGWAFSNIVSIVRLHLFNYLSLFSFLENPEKAVISLAPQSNQMSFNLSG